MYSQYRIMMEVSGRVKSVKKRFVTIPETHFQVTNNLVVVRYQGYREGRLLLEKLYRVLSKQSATISN